MPRFDGTEGAPIALDQAASWTANYRRNAAAGENGVVIKGHFYGKDILQKILDQPGCMGIRIYHARDGRGQRQLVLVGANAEGEDMVEGTVADSGKLCPPDCVVSELNG
ncbi:hypothetical protein ACFSRY_13755 [Pontibacter locisalis]|uniref:Uncharacterized protein n=1 Tax=Pontibacter locisalis TaxID=1719035 RepID=A0ABW5IPL8_9BACT